MRKIVFIIPQLSQPRCIKRVNAFNEAGFEVEVFGFDKGLYSNNIASYSCETHSIIDKGRATRIQSICQSIKLVREVKKCLKRNDLVYIFGIEQAFYYRLLCGKNAFLYEQADLNYTKLSQKLLVLLFRRIDKYLIAKSYKTVLTSQGFVDYLYGGKKAPTNIILLENRLNKELKTISVKEHPINTHAIKFAFIGAIRYPRTILTFARVVAEYFPTHQFHFYGEGLFSSQAKALCERYPNNLFYHGGFSNPRDLPVIYSNVDLNVVCYDTASMNVRIAEPNKLYESCFFRVPLVVSSSTFLEKKVLNMGVGFSIDCTKESEIISFIESINKTSFDNCLEAMRRIPDEQLFDNTNELIQSLK